MTPTITVPHTVSVIAPAKINLSLDILGQRDDGYHNIITLFQSLSLYDTLTFRFLPIEPVLPPDNSKTVTIAISLSKTSSAVEVEHFPLDEQNSISKAIELFFSQLPRKSSVAIAIEVEKKIPIGAGLAGGSTDAAATLLALNSYFNNLFSNEQLIQFASQIGSDVAFCLMGGLAIGRGRGEQLQRTNLALDKHFILVKPRSIFISTPWAYKTYDEAMASAGEINARSESFIESRIENVLKIMSNKEAGNNSANNSIFWNAFEPVIFKEYPLLAEIKERLLNLGCLEAHLTGSGPTVYGLARSQEEGEKILHNILERDTAKTNKVILDAWLTKTIASGVQVSPALIN